MALAAITQAKDMILRTSPILVVTRGGQCMKVGVWYCMHESGGLVLPKIKKRGGWGVGTNSHLTLKKIKGKVIMI